MFLGIENQDKDRIALEDDSSKKITYGQLSDICNRFMNLQLPRSVVFILCENTCGAMVSLCACESSKIVPLLLSASTDEKLLADLIDIYQPSYLFAPSDSQHILHKKVIWRELDYVAVDMESVPYEINEKLSLLMTTSGSTGSPKLVRHKYGNLESNAKNAACAFRWKDDEKSLCDLPIHYTMGLNVINSHLIVGGTVVLTKHSLMSVGFWNIMKNAGITNFCGVPFSYDIFSKLHFTKMDLPSLRAICEGGGKLTDKRFKEYSIYASEKGKSFFASFGTTETSARMAVLPPELALEKTGSIGKAIPEGELYLIDSHGNEIEDIESEGELGYRGPNVTMGYAMCKEDLLKDDEWRGEYHTGDIAYRDSDGCYFIIGRTNRFLKIYGLRISLDRTELLIKSKFDIECVCTGTDDRMEIFITDETYKKKIIPYISKKTNIQPIMFHMNIVDEIPKNESGKINYSALKSKQQ